jgi:hypothetical protein
MSKVLDGSTSESNLLHRLSRASFSNHYRLLRNPYANRSREEIFSELPLELYEDLSLEEKVRLADAVDESK